VVAGEKRNEPVLVTPIVETDFTQLLDGTICEMIEDPKDPSRTALAVFKNGHVDYLGQMSIPVENSPLYRSEIPHP